MADKGEKDEVGDKVTILDVLKSLIRPFNFENVCTYYLPIAGAASYSLFSVNILNPEHFFRCMPSYRFAISNSLLFNSHIGTGMFLYFRPHMQKITSCYHRVMFSTYGAVLFNFGSVLLWAVTKALLPQNSRFREMFGICTSLCLLSIGREYVQHVDELANQD